MNRCTLIAPAIARREYSHLLRSLAFAVFALALCVTALACNQTAGATQSSDYGATVEALLPTTAPTIPPTPTSYSDFRSAHGYSSANVHSAPPALLHALAYANQGHDRGP